MWDRPMDSNKRTPGLPNPGKEWKPVLFHDYTDEKEYLKVCDILCGDKKAFDGLVKEYQKVAERWAKELKSGMIVRSKKLKELNDYAEDKDLVQDMWLKLIKIIPGKFRIKSSKSETVCTFYINVERKIFNLLRNEVRNHLRAVSRRNEVKLDNYKELSKEYDFLDFDVYLIHFPKRELPVKDPEVADMVNACLGKMSEKERKIFELAIMTKKPYVLIGEMTDLSEKTIRNTMSKLYKLLRDSENKDNDEEAPDVDDSDKDKKK